MGGRLMLHLSVDALAKLSAPILVAALIATISPCNAEEPDSDPLAKVYAELVPPPANQALAEIPDVGRKLLALRSYLRAGSRLVKRWSWTKEDIKAFQTSKEQQSLLDEVAAVSAHFAQANPGYQIYVHATIRSLEVQIQSWNSNESVGIPAEELLTKWKEEFGADVQSWGNLEPKKVRKWLSSYDGANRPAIAAPGLSLHGQARAIDFQIKQNGAIIAGTSSKQVEKDWRAAKWEVKLRESILAAGPSFRGPLTSPDEPWHYEYDPANRTAVKNSAGE